MQRSPSPKNLMRIIIFESKNTLTNPLLLINRMIVFLDKIALEICSFICSAINGLPKHASKDWFFLS